jgi:hypothetical protein
MIKTAEAITDPVSYIVHNVIHDEGTQTALDAAGFVIVSGADYDVLVQKKHGEALEIGRKDFVVSRLLGSLYTAGTAEGVAYEADHLDLCWFPSPAHANRLTEQLGLVAGRDVLRFVHADSDAIPALRYKDHLAAGEYPLSTGERYFRHDRGFDHAVAVLTMPPTVTQHVIAFAANASEKQERKAEKNFMRDSVVSVFDSGTAAIRRIAELVLTDDAGFDAMSSFDYRRLDDTYKLLPHTVKQSLRKPTEAKIEEMAQVIEYYTHELAPKLAALQAVTPKLAERAGVHVQMV